jgi:hypothetical protein
MSVRPANVQPPVQRRTCKPFPALPCRAAHAITKGPLGTKCRACLLVDYYAVMSPSDSRIAATVIN